MYEKSSTLELTFGGELNLSLVKSLSCLPFCWYYYSCLPKFSKISYLLEDRQETFIHICFIYIYIINKYLNKLKKNIFYVIDYTFRNSNLKP